MERSSPFARQSGCVAIGGRGVLIEGPPGTGKTSLALALIDRGASLIGDDSVMLFREQNRLIATPHPNTKGLVEVRNLGLISLPCADEATVALIIVLDSKAPRYIEAAEFTELAGISVPTLRIWPQDSAPALKVELAVERFALRL